MLGIDEQYNKFDTDIIIDINSAFGILNQLGVGPATGFSIQDASSTWNDFIPIASTQSSVILDMAKTYIYLKVKLIFDPPTVGAVMEATKQTIAEYEWRLKTQAELEKTN